MLLELLRQFVAAADELVRTDREQLIDPVVHAPKLGNFTERRE